MRVIEPRYGDPDAFGQRVGERRDAARGQPYVCIQDQISVLVSGRGYRGVDAGGISEVASGLDQGCVGCDTSDHGAGVVSGGIVSEDQTPVRALGTIPKGCDQIVDQRCTVVGDDTDCYPGQVHCSSPDYTPVVCPVG